eukprot:scaffold73466_cov39-Tisochrysis_lutea.AAC.2
MGDRGESLMSSASIGPSAVIAASRASQRALPFSPMRRSRQGRQKPRVSSRLMYAATTELITFRAIPGTSPKSSAPAATNGPANGRGMTEQTTMLMSEYSIATTSGPPGSSVRSMPKTCSP